MKTFLNIMITLCLVSFTNAQDSVKQRETINNKEDLQQLINSKSFVFEVQTVLPLAGGAINNISSDFTLTILPQKIISNLPYYGRAYVAPMNPGESGVQFTSDSFVYNLKETKKGWEISIKPDQQKVQQMQLIILKDGYATLSVTSSDKQQISYRGVIKKYKDRSA